MNWGAFWAGLLGTTIPGVIASLVVWHFTRRANVALEMIKTELAQDTVRFSKWHERRIDACVAIYSAFGEYLDFLRKALYWEESKASMNGMHDFNRVVERQLIFLDDQLAEKILTYKGELFLFWNDTMLGKRVASEETRRKLDYEIPAYLPRLRRDINRTLDPRYTEQGEEEPTILRAMERGLRQ
jgi:hypothetical protein